MFKLCNSTGDIYIYIYIYDTNVYLGQDRQRTVQHLTTTRATVTNLTRKVEGFGHNLYRDNFFSSPDLFDNLDQKKLTVVGQ